MDTMRTKASAPMPQALVDRIKAARTYGQGYATTELLAASLLDLEWHGLSADAPKQDPDAFEAAALVSNSFAFGGMNSVLLARRLG